LFGKFLYRFSCVTFCGQGLPPDGHLCSQFHGVCGKHTVTFAVHRICTVKRPTGYRPKCHLLYWVWIVLDKTLLSGKISAKQFMKLSPIMFPLTFFLTTVLFWFSWVCVSAFENSHFIDRSHDECLTTFWPETPVLNNSQFVAFHLCLRCVL